MVFSTFRYTFAKSVSAAFIVLVALSPTKSDAATIVPGNLAAVEGNSNNNIPFKPASGQARYQQFFDASLFAGPITITGMAFRLDGGIAGNQTFAYNPISISMSTAALATPVGTFANNIGADVVNVFNQAFNATIVGSGAPIQNFDLIFNFTTPFNYNPANGNLMFDVFQTTSGLGIIQLDVHGGGSFDGPRVFNLNAASPVAQDILLGRGLVTQFTIADVNAVPLPAALPLLGAGLAMLGFVGWRRNRAA